MPIVDLQRRLVELGRIRTGDQVEFRDAAGRTRRRPRRLETFRLTSPRRDLVEEAARLYGGVARAWGEQWEVTVTAPTVPIMLPPGEVVSQWMEMWSGGGIVRRCDGVREVIGDGPCLCPADPAERRELAARGEACKPTTRINVILPDLPGLGVWRLDSTGWYAAVELAGAAEYLSMATSVGHRIPAHLRIVTRTVKRPGPSGPVTRTFTVPTIDIAVRPADLLAGTLPAGPSPAPLERLPAGPVNRRERVPRPVLPGGADLPDEARFERDVPHMAPPPDFGEMAPGAAGEAEPTVPDATPVESRTMLPALTAGLSVPEFVAAVAGIDPARVRRMCADMHPGRTVRTLSDAERGVLAARLCAEAPVVPVPAGAVTACESPSPHGELVCLLPSGHRGAHRGSERESWS